MHQIIALWAHPRSLSTALERIFMERGDFNVLHEPFSALYYVREKKAAAVQAQFASDAVTDYASVRDNILEQAVQQPVCFKDMCYHCHDHLLRDKAFLGQLTNVFLVREPQQSIASHYAMNPDVTLDEIGYEKQASIFRALHTLTGSWPAVISAERLQQQPADVIRALCDKLGLDDRPQALQWRAGQRTEWGNWEAWHHEVAQSSGIQRQQKDYKDTVDNNPLLADFARHHRPFYDEMHAHRLDPDA